MLIGILQAGHAPDEMRPDVGDYDTMFERLLGGRGFSFRTWSVVDFDFPNSVEAADGWLITGSRHGAYEDHAWIPPLEQFIRAAFMHPVPMVGICFGHQIIAQAMGGRVEKSAKGWGVGAMRYEWSGRGEVVLNAWHQDQVVDLPETAQVVARNPFCDSAALLYGDRMFTIQPHPEFGPEVIAGLIRHRGAALPADRLEIARAGLDAAIDSKAVAQDIGDFFLMERG